MSRACLPARRSAETFELMAGGLRFTCSIGRFADGRLAEIFLPNHKAGSHADSVARDSAIVCSLALQHGADPEVIRRALCRDSNGVASGPLGVALDIIAGQS
jgi:ribonucleoside-diphosphate reductase alpha chain